MGAISILGFIVWAQLGHHIHANVVIKICYMLETLFKSLESNMFVNELFVTLDSVDLYSRKMLWGESISRNDSVHCLFFTVGSYSTTLHYIVSSETTRGTSFYYTATLVSKAGEKYPLSLSKNINTSASVQSTPSTHVDSLDAKHLSSHKDFYDWFVGLNHSC